MSHGQTIKLSTPLKRNYNTITLHGEDDPSMKFDLSGLTQYVDAGLNLTIYKESDRSTIVSRGIDSQSFTLEVPDYSFGSCRCVAVVEDRSASDKIVAKQTIAYIYFKQYSGGKDLAVLGHGEVKLNDGSTITIPYYEGGYVIY